MKETAESVVENIKAHGFVYRFFMSFTDEAFLDKILRETLTVISRLLTAYIVFKIGQKVIAFLLKTFDRLDKRSTLEKHKTCDSNWKHTFGEDNKTLSNSMWVLTWNIWKLPITVFLSIYNLFSKGQKGFSVDRPGQSLYE